MLGRLTIFHTEFRHDMSRKIFLGMLLVLLLRPSEVRAAIGYGNGEYTNLCDSGTKATYYSCDAGCDPTLGIKHIGDFLY